MCRPRGWESSEGGEEEAIGEAWVGGKGSFDASEMRSVQPMRFAAWYGIVERKVVGIQTAMAEEKLQSRGVVWW